LPGEGWFPNGRKEEGMRRRTMIWASAVLLAGAMFGSISCATRNGTEEVDLIETEDGAIIVDTLTVAATVTGIDTGKRKVTLVSPGGQKTTYKCGPEVVNFDQIEVGDQVKATVTEEAAIFIGTGAPPSETAGAGVALAPVGAKPGGVFVKSLQVTAQVIEINVKKHKVTLAFPDGTTKRVKVGKKVDLNAVPLGTDLTVQVSEGIAITVQKP
jgi:hypothetical protein